MKKHKENLFSTKFCLLDSQEYPEEIVWSSSDSSEFDDVNNKSNLKNITNKKPNRKRKCKSKVPRNVSSLDIAIIDTNKGSQGDISPVLTCKTKPKAIEFGHDRTYLISKYPEHNDSIPNMTSPVLCTGTQRANVCIKSPVIAQKFASPAQSPKVRKKLFNETKNKKSVPLLQRSVSPVLSHHFAHDQRKTQEAHFKKEIKVSSDTPILETQNSVEFQEKDSQRVQKNSKNSLNLDLIKKVQSFFENHFNSENSSQHSIADTPTPKNTSSDDLEILSITQMTSNECSIKTKHTNSTDNTLIETEKSKKMKYKKDGLAYRLNSLLKKHNANISLWQHERFLAENSNFKIPKGECLVFRIQKVNYKYGSYLLEAMDVNDDVFLILINKTYVNNCIFRVDSVFQLYEPYHISSFDENKFIVNVCKFECVAIDAVIT